MPVKRGHQCRFLERTPPLCRASRPYRATRTKDVRPGCLSGRNRDHAWFDLLNLANKYPEHAAIRRSAVLTLGRPHFTTLHTCAVFWSMPTNVFNAFVSSTLPGRTGRTRPGGVLVWLQGSRPPRRVPDEPSPREKTVSARVSPSPHRLARRDHRAKVDQGLFVVRGLVPLHRSSRHEESWVWRLYSHCCPTMYPA